MGWSDEQFVVIPTGLCEALTIKDSTKTKVKVPILVEKEPLVQGLSDALIRRWRLHRKLFCVRRNVTQANFLWAFLSMCHSKLKLLHLVSILRPSRSLISFGWRNQILCFYLTGKNVVLLTEHGLSVQYFSYMEIEKLTIQKIYRTQRLQLNWLYTNFGFCTSVKSFDFWRHDFLQKNQLTRPPNKITLIKSTLLLWAEGKAGLKCQ